MKKDLFEKIRTLLKIVPDCEYNILDIGCGRGELPGILASSVKAGSYLLGIDENEDSIEQAQVLYPDIEFLCQSFKDTLNFKDDGFDIVLSVDTLECIVNKTALINEIHRILKPGGKVLFAHWDWDTQVYNSTNKSIMRNFVAAFSDWQQDWMEASDGQMGRRLWGLFESSGKFKGNFDSFTLIETEFREGNYGFERLHDLSGLVEEGIIDGSEHKMILNEMRKLSNAREYFYSVNSYIYVGKKV